MTREQVKEVLDRMLTWPPERQEDAVEILKAVEEQDASEAAGSATAADEERPKSDSVQESLQAFPRPLSMKVTLDPGARADVGDIHAWIAKRNEVAG
jgi:hypothetical protein